MERIIVHALRTTVATAALAGMTALGLTGCSPSAFQDPIFRINGSCTTKSGTLLGVGSGFSDSALYQTVVTKPDGSSYDLSKDFQFGTTSETGTIELNSWKWPCKGDPAGTYSVSIKDLSSKKVAKTKFTIG